MSELPAPITGCCLRHWRSCTNSTATEALAAITESTAQTATWAVLLT